MNPKTKNTSITDKPPGPVTNSPRIMDEKTYQQYKLKAHKIFIRSVIIAPTILVAWSVYALINGHSDVINLSRVPLVIILCACFYVVNKTILHIKYKLPIFGGCNNSSFSSDHKMFSVSNDPFRDNNPTYPGTAAYHAREMRN